MLAMPSEHSHLEECCIYKLPICRRMLNMNLALGHTEEFYSLKALAEKHTREPEDIFELAYDYVQARDCFKKEWDKMKTVEECPLQDECLSKKCFAQ